MSLRTGHVARLMLAMTVAFGLATQGARAGGTAHKTTMHADAVTTHMAMVAAATPPRCDKCDHCKNGSCKGEGCTSSSACAASCGSFPALSAVSPVLPIPDCESPTETSEASGSGWAHPPDPHPPRTIILN